MKAGYFRSQSFGFVREEKERKEEDRAGNDGWRRAIDHVILEDGSK